MLLFFWGGGGGGGGGGINALNNLMIWKNIPIFLNPNWCCFHLMRIQ